MKESDPAPPKSSAMMKKRVYNLVVILLCGLGMWACLFFSAAACCSRPGPLPAAQFAIDGAAGPSVTTDFREYLDAAYFDGSDEVAQVRRRAWDAGFVYVREVDGGSYQEVVRIEAARDAGALTLSAPLSSVGSPQQYSRSLHLDPMTGPPWDHADEWADASITASGFVTMVSGADGPEWALEMVPAPPAGVAPKEIVIYYTPHAASVARFEVARLYAPDERAGWCSASMPIFVRDGGPDRLVATNSIPCGAP